MPVKSNPTGVGDGRTWIVLALLSAVTPCCCLAGEDEPPPEVAKLESAILNARRSIRSGEFNIEVSSNAKHTPHVLYHFWLGQDEQVRQERNLGKEVQVSIFDKEYAYYYFKIPGMLENPDFTRRPAIERLPIQNARRDMLPHHICDPRVIMLTPVQYVLHPRYGLESIVNARGRDKFTISDAMWNGLDAEAVSFTMPRTGDLCEYVVVPSRSYNIVRWRLSGVVHPEKGGGELAFDNTLVAELTQIGDSIWFPTTTRLQNTWNSHLELEEGVKISVGHLNEKIPDAVFTLGFDNLPDKQLIVQAPVYELSKTPPSTQPTHGPESHPLYWSAGQIRPLTSRDEVERKLSGHQNDRYVPTYRLRSIAFLLLVAGITAVSAWIWKTTRARVKQ